MAGLFGLPTGSGATLPPGLIANPQDAGLVPAPLAASGIVAAPPDGIVGAPPQAQAAPPAPVVPQPPTAPPAAPPPQQPPPPPPPNLFMDAVKSAGSFVSGLTRLPGDYLTATTAQLEAEPQNIALQLAQRRFQLQQMGQLMSVLSDPKSGMTAAEKLAILLNGGEVGKQLATREAAPANAAGGSSYWDPNTQQMVQAPLVGFDPKSGGGYAVGGQGDLTTGGARLPGSVSATNGLLVDDRNPVPVGTYEQNVSVPPGDVLHKVAPAVYRGPQVPQLPNGAPAPVGAGPIVPQLGGDGAVGQAAPPSAGFSSGLGIPQIGDPPAPTAANTSPPMAPAPASSPTASLSAIRANPAGFFGSVLGKPVTITSAQRSASRNAAVGGSPTSEHLTGSAWDMSVPGMATTEVASKLAAAGVPFDQIIDEGNHTHFGIGPKMRGQVLQADGKGGYRPLGGAAAGATTSAAPSADTEIAGHDSASGTSGPLFTIKPGSQVPGGDPSQDYKVNTATGDATISPKAFNMETVQGNRKAFYASEQFKAASENMAPVKALFDTVSTIAPGGVMGVAAMDTLNKSLSPGGVVRPQSVQLFLDHLGLPEELKSYILSVTGNGFLSPPVVQQIGRTSWLYARSHIQQAADMATRDTQLAVAHGFKPGDVDETAPDLPGVPKWAQDTVPAPAQRVVGQTYWGPKGPGTWTGKGWRVQ